MSALSVVLSLFCFALLTLGTAVFVAAEFSLTALERSTVDANARTGGPRDAMAPPYIADSARCSAMIDVPASSSIVSQQGICSG